MRVDASIFNDGDLAQLRERGLSVQEALRQLELAKGRPCPFVLLRPCTLGDGIVPLGLGRGSALFEAARRAGRLSAFIPAAGAATRMFEALSRFQRQPQSPAGAVEDFIWSLPRFPFYDELKAAAGRRGLRLESISSPRHLAEVLEVLLGPKGLGYAELPKGLLPFHRCAEGPRTALEESAAEFSPLLKDRSGAARLHFVVSAEHLGRFEAFSKERLAKGRRFGAKLEISFSVQKPSTDTLAIAGDGRPFRNGGGRLLFRPAGHGALLENLAGCGGDLVFLQNIDNVAVPRFHEETRAWKMALAGLLLELQESLFEHLERLESGAGARDVSKAADFAAKALALELPGDWKKLSVRERSAWLRFEFDRPLRICGVVKNEGEPGGAPFWVKGPDGRVSRQLVERGQIDGSEDGQKLLFASSTHFNPVNMACALRRRDGRPFELRRHVDEEAVIVARKSSGGRELIALELPGLWNGAMGGWITVFAEVPVSTFHPVKTVNDLLKEGHQA